MRRGGAFKVRRGERDLEAIARAEQLAATATWSRCSRKGRGGKRGCGSGGEAERAPGAARIALGAGVPLVPAAIKGTDRLSRFGGSARAVRGAGADRRPARPRPARGRKDRDGPADGADPSSRRRYAGACGRCSSIDGDSLAHRAYHALPKSIRGAGGRPANALVGFANFLLRLWDAERRARCSSAGTRSTRRPTATRRSPAYQSGREFDDELLEQLDVLPGLVADVGLRVAKAPGYEADDFLAAARGERRGRGRRSSRRRTATRSSSCRSDDRCSSR